MNELYPYEPRTPEEGKAGCLGTLIGIILGICICAMIGSCSTCRITEADNIHDTCFITKVQRDSIHIFDSTFVYQYEKGETVHVDRTRWMVSYRDKVIRDTVYVHIVDTIKQNASITKEESMTQKIKRFFSDLFDIVLIMSFGLIAFLLILWIKGK